MRICMFGDLSIETDGPRIDKFPTQKSACLLSFLAFHKGQWYSREYLADQFWPSASSNSARQSLRTAVTHLRHLLHSCMDCGEKALESDRIRVRLSAYLVDTDVSQYNMLLKQARAGSLGEQCLLLQRACELQTEPLLSRFYDDWIVGERSVLEDSLCESYRLLANAAASLGDFAEAISAAQRLVRLAQYDQSGYFLLVDLFRRSGRADRAREVAQQWQDIVRTELNGDDDNSVEELNALVKLPMALNDSALQNGGPPIPNPVAYIPPVFSRFFGRENEIDHLSSLLSRHYVEQFVLQIVGHAGVGKTRTAIEACRRSALYADERILWLNVAGTRSQVEIVQKFVVALRIDGNSVDVHGIICALLARDKFLVVLDGIDRLLEHSETEFMQLLDMIMARAHGTSILTTARRVCNIKGAHITRLAPLPTPDDVNDVAEITDNPCIQLLVDRIHAVHPVARNIATLAADIPLLAKLGRQLEGIPLSLELAAGWAGCLTLQQIVVKFSNPLNIDSPTSNPADRKQASLRSVIAESVEMLPVALRDLFMRLSVFPSGCSLSACTFVCLGDEGIITTDDRAKQVAALLDRSLVHAEMTMDEMRYRQLDVVRRYAKELLDRAGELDRIKLNMLRWAQHLGADCSRLINHGDEIVGLTRLTYERANLEECLCWALSEQTTEERAVSGISLAVSLSVFWQITGNFREGTQYLERALELATKFGLIEKQIEVLAELSEHALRQGNSDAATSLASRGTDLANSLKLPLRLAQTILTMGRAAVKQNRLDKARSFITEALQLAQSNSHLVVEAQCYNNLGIISYLSADYEGANVHYHEALTRWYQLNSTRGIAACLQNIGLLDWMQGDYFSAQLRYTEAKVAWERTNDRTSMSACLLNLGSLDCDRKSYDTARAWIEQALALARDAGDLVGTANCLNNLGVVLIELHEHLQAARNLEEARHLYEKAGVTSGVAFCKYNMGLIYFERAEMERATRYLLESLELRVAAGDRRGVVESLELACAASASVLPPGVLSTLVGAITNAREQYHMPRSDRRTDELTTLAIVELRAADPDYYANVLYGKRLTLPEAVDLLNAQLKHDSPILKH